MKRTLVTTVLAGTALMLGQRRARRLLLPIRRVWTESGQPRPVIRKAQERATGKSPSEPE